MAPEFDTWALVPNPVKNEVKKVLGDGDSEIGREMLGPLVNCGFGFIAETTGDAVNVRNITPPVMN